MRMTRLSRFFGVKGGTTPSTANSAYWNGDIPWVTPADMEGGTVETLFDTRAKVTSLAVEESSLLISQPGWLILSNRAPIGKVAICGTRMCTNQGCKLIYPLRNVEYSTKFLAYWFLSHQEQLNSLGSGTTFLEISTEKLLSFPIPVVSYATQCKIVEDIDRRVCQIDNIVESKKDSLIKLIEYRQAFIAQSVTTGGGDWIALRRLVKIDPPTKLPRQGMVEYLPMEQIKQGFFIHRVADVSELPSSLNAFAQGDILLSKVTPCFENGNVCRAEEVCNGIGYCSTELFVVRCWSKLINPTFLMLLFQQEKFKQEAIKMMRGTGGLKRIPIEWLLSYKMEVPTLQKQSEIVELIFNKSKYIDSCVRKLRDEIIKLGEYRDSFISLKLSGT